MKAYYDARAAEYDDWWMGTGLFAARDRPGWAAEVLELERALAALTPARTLDVACGTGFLTRHLPVPAGGLVGIDQSERMAAIARTRVPDGRFLVADAFAVPYADHSFERVFTGHFYGHLDAAERAAFLAEARRLAPELVVVDSAPREGVPLEGLAERVLNDGSRWEVLKRFFTADALLDELCALAGADPARARPVFRGRWFGGVRVALR